jgi:hypothetical protein
MRTFSSASAGAPPNANAARQKTTSKWTNLFIDGPHSPAVLSHRVILLTLTGSQPLRFEENSRGLADG